MYSISDTYKNYIVNSKVRVPKSKITVGGTEYTGATHLKTYPKVEHSTEDMFGSFPTKSCEFEIYNVNGDVVLNGKEVSVWRGLEIEGDTHWIPMGIFKAENEDITHNLTSKTVKFKGSDRSHLFDVAFNPDLHTYPCTILQFVLQLCSNHNIVLKSETFPFSDFVLETAPEISESTTERELIRKIAQLGACIAQITREGELKISQPETANIPIISGKYSSLAKENIVYVTGISITRASDEDITVSDSAFAGAYGEFIYRIVDNPFIKGKESETVDKISASYIGRNITPFTLSGFIDDYIFDMNDLITISDKNGNEFTTPLLSIKTQSRIKSDFGADFQKDSTDKEYNLEGSLKTQVEESKKAIKQNEEFIKNFNEQLEIGLKKGCYRIVKQNEDGSKTTYYCDTPEIEKATYIFTFGARGMAWSEGSGCWNGGNPIWKYGTTAEGDAILENLLLRTLTADLIRAGKLESIAGNAYFDLDEGVIGVTEKDSDGKETFSAKITPTGLSLAADKIEVNTALTEEDEAEIDKILLAMGFVKDGTLEQKVVYIAMFSTFKVLFSITKKKYGINITGKDSQGNEYAAHYGTDGVDFFKLNTDGTMANSKVTADGIESDSPQTFKAPEFNFEGKVCIGNRVLWEGESHMGADHYIDLPEGINEQATGIVLVFSPYNGTAIQTHNYKTFFIPKYMVEVQGGMGYSFFLTSNDLKSIGTKYIYISNKRLSGNAVGIGSGTTNGITYDSAKWCLRYVIGV